jgi:hypothetical protein
MNTRSMSFKNIDKRDRLFRRGSLKEKTSLSIHTPIFEALKLLSERSGDSMSDIVTDVLDQYLTDMVEAGHLDKPVIVPVASAPDENRED